MILSDPRRDAIRLKARRAVGVETPEGRERPEANALKLGVADESPRVAEDSSAVIERSKLWYFQLKPQTAFHAWLVDQVTITSLKIERNGRIERRLRDRIALRAETSWDADRRLDAEQIGLDLARRPTLVARKLERTLQGCEWLIDRWAMLARIADLEGGWDAPRRSLAFDLLGTPLEARSGEQPGQSVDREGQPLGPPPAPADLARREVARLMPLSECLAEPDALEQSLAEADLADSPTPEARRVRRHEETLYARLRWLVRQIQFESPRKAPSPWLQDYFNPDDPPKDETPTPEPEPSGQVVAPDEVEVDGDGPLEALNRSPADARPGTAQSPRRSRDTGLGPRQP